MKEIKSMWNFIEKIVPLRRTQKSLDVANAFIFLASSKASYITGTALKADGGMMEVTQAATTL